MYPSLRLASSLVSNSRVGQWLQIETAETVLERQQEEALPLARH